MDIILHIGRHKTGTTYLQKFLSINENLLLKRAGILYPKTGRDTFHHYHHPVFRDVIVEGKPMDAELVRAIFEEGTKRGASKILLSSESLSRCGLNEEQLRDVCRSFGRNNVSLIVYLRRQDAFLQSTYAERVKRGLLAAPETIHDINACLDYHKFIQKYASVFRPENIKIRNYEYAAKAGIHKDILEALGIKYDSEFTLPESRSNERLPWAYIELLRNANASKYGRRIFIHPLVRKIAIKMSHLFPNYMDRAKPLTAIEIELVNKKYAESNKKLLQEYINQDRNI